MVLDAVFTSALIRRIDTSGKLPVFLSTLCTDFGVFKPSEPPFFEQPAVNQKRPSATCTFRNRYSASKNSPLRLLT